MDAEQLKSQLRSKQKRKSIEIPGLGTVWIRELTAAALVDFVGDGDEAAQSEQFERMLGVIIAGTISEDGSPAMEDTPEFRESLRELTEETAALWFQAILELCGVTDDEKKDSAPAVSLHTG